MLARTSSIYNATAYRYLILSFELWSKAPKDIQTVHLSHFRDLVKTSKLSVHITPGLESLLC